MNGRATCVAVMVLLAAYGCSSSSDEETTPQTGGASTSGGSNEKTGGTTTGGTAQTGGTAPVQTGGTQTGGTQTGGTQTGGNPPVQGGSPPTDTGGAPPTDTGGAPPTDTGGAPPTDTGGAPATGGTATGGTATGGAGPFVYPDGGCGNNPQGTAIGKDVQCSASDPTQVCDKNCGPVNVGYKTETCDGAKYVESSCIFPPSANYGCFKVPAADSPNCPAGVVPRHNAECPAPMTVCQTAPIGTACAQTTPCDLCGVSGGYQDSGGSSKTGYCVCIPSTSMASGMKWACASNTAWPPQS